MLIRPPQVYLINTLFPSYIHKHQSSISSSNIFRYNKTFLEMFSKEKYIMDIFWRRYINRPLPPILSNDFLNLGFCNSNIELAFDLFSPQFSINLHFK